MAKLFLVPSAMSGGGGRKRKAEDDNLHNDHDTRMSASPSHSPPSSRSSRTVKKVRPNITGRPLSVPRLLETLDTDSLRSVLRSLCDQHPEMVAEVVNISPRPTVASALEVLGRYYSAFRSSFPLGSNPSSDYAYNRVRQRLADLLDALNDFTPQFLPPNELQTSTSLSFLDGATDIINRIPEWDSPQNNVNRDAAYEELSKAWALVIKEAARRGGGIQLRHGDWDHKIAKHNQASGGKLHDAVNELNSSLSWMTGDVSFFRPGADRSTVRSQLLNGTYGPGLPLKVGPW